MGSGGKTQQQNVAVPSKKTLEALEKEEQNCEAAAELPAEPKKILKVHDLPEQINLYLIEIYPIDDKLFLFGIL